jgi:hypothetical protein
MLDLPTHRSWGALTHHLVFRGSLATFHATLTKLGVVHDWSTGPEGPTLGLMGLNVSTGGYGGVLVEDPVSQDEDPGVVHGGRPAGEPRIVSMTVVGESGPLMISPGGSAPWISPEESLTEVPEKTAGVPPGALTIAYPPGQSADHYDSPAAVQGVSDAYAMGDWMRRDAGRD